MKRSRYYLILSSLCIWGWCTFLSSCQQTAKVKDKGSALSPQYDSICANSNLFSDKVEIKYAKGLKVSYTEDSIFVEISNPTTGKGHEQLVLPRNPEAQQNKTFICTTALQLGNFEILNVEDRIVGINSLKNIFSSNIIRQIEQGTTSFIGKEGNFDVEAVIAAHPDYIFVSASKHGGFEALKTCGIPLVSHHGYKETNPLGQAEWIKLVGLLTGETRRANALFSYIEQEYCSLRDHVHSAVDSTNTVTVLSGRQLRDGWYIMGGDSYMAHLFEDAGADYLMKDNEVTGGVTLDFETVYARGINADFWQIDGNYDGEYTLDVLASEDARYCDIAAFKKGGVMFCNLSQKPYRELAGVEPHIMLADFVRAFHPNLLPGHKAKYYELIR